MKLSTAYVESLSVSDQVLAAKLLSDFLEIWRRGSAQVIVRQSSGVVGRIITASASIRNYELKKPQLFIEFLCI